MRMMTPLKSAFFTIAPSRRAELMIAFVRFASERKSNVRRVPPAQTPQATQHAPVRFAPVRLHCPRLASTSCARGRRRRAGCQERSRVCHRAVGLRRRTFAPVKFASDRSAPNSVTPSRLLPLKLARFREPCVQRGV